MTDDKASIERTAARLRKARQAKGLSSRTFEANELELEQNIKAIQELLDQPTELIL